MSAQLAFAYREPVDLPSLDASGDVRSDRDSLVDRIGNAPSLADAITAFLHQHGSMSFVQVGGFDGVSHDPLRPFIVDGSLAGLIVEPLADPFAKLTALYADSTTVRIANCAVTEADGPRTMWRFKPEAIEQGLLNAHFAGTSSLLMEQLLADQGSLGQLFTEQQRTLLRTLVEPVEVTCRGFASLFAEHGIEQVDLLQIDTEGYDLNILKAFDFARHKPAIVNFENLHLSADDKKAAERLLAGHGYTLFHNNEDTLAVLDEAKASVFGVRATPDLADFDGLRGNVIFCLWTGSNALTPARAESLLSIYGQTCCPVMFLSVNNIRKWELPGSPFHPAYEFLSETHKADYLRCYLLHHFGGGYTDLKRATTSWAPYFAMLRERSEALGLGYREIGPHGIAPCGEPLESELRRNFDKVIGNTAYIFRKDTAFTRAWIGSVHALLDSKLEAFKAYPARHPMDQTGAVLPDQTVSQYPLAWTEMLGNIFHPLSYAFRSRIIQADIAPSFQNYR